MTNINNALHTDETLLMHYILMKNMYNALHTDDKHL